MRIIKMMSGDLIPITEDEFASLAKKSSGLVFVPSLNEMLNISSIERVMTEDGYKKIAKDGVLHDGTRVIKRFGEWVNAQNPEIKLDRHYYPEIANDTVARRLPTGFDKVLKLDRPNVARTT